MLKLMTMNINQYATKRGPWEQRRTLIAEAIRAANPDVIALQAVRRDPAADGGVDQATQIARRLGTYPHVSFCPSGPAPGGSAGAEEGVALLSRLPLEDERTARLSRRDGHEDVQDRALLGAKIQADGTPVQVINTYASWVPEQNEDNVEEAVAFAEAASEPALVVGDFNASPEAPALRRLAERGYVDAWQALHREDPGWTFEAPRPDRRIDYVWASPELSAALDDISLVARATPSSEISASDHLGLVASLRVG